MKKYDNGGYGSEDYSGRPKTLDPLINQNEKIIWEGKPNRRAFILQKTIFLICFSSFWFLVDMIAITVLFIVFDSPPWYLIPLILVHAAPAWICLTIALTAKPQWKRTYYMATTQKIIIRTGLVDAEYRILYYPDITNVALRIGFWDRIFGVGDIHFSAKTGSTGGAFVDIDDPHSFFPVIQKIVLDIRTDMYYPNQLRPGVNPGYNTEYDAEQFKR